MGRRAGPDCSQRRHQAWAETFLPRLRFAAIAMDRRYPLKFSQGDGIKAYFKLKPNVGKTAFMNEGENDEKMGYNFESFSPLKYERLEEYTYGL